MKYTLMHHCQPRPNIGTSSFNNGVQKGRWEWNHPSFTKVWSSMLLPPKGHLKYLFQKRKEKNGGYFNDMPETFCQREINRENFVSFNMLYVGLIKPCA
jgi:hypothetical protein